MKITPKEYAGGLFESILGKDDNEIGKIVANFTDLLIKNNDLSKVDKVTQIFSSLWNKEYGVVETEVTSAKKLDVLSLDSLKQLLISRSGAKKVIIEEKIDNSILGGVIIKYNDNVLDKSLKTRIRDLSNSIKS